MKPKKTPRSNFRTVTAIFITICSVVVATLTSVSPATATASTEYAPPLLVWEQCSDAPGRDCATLTVPLDYWGSSPTETIDLPVVKVPATDPDHRIGTLVFNPGGPGAQAGQFLKSSDYDLSFTFSAELRARFDIVAYDPRGTTDGISCISSAQQAQYWGTNHIPRTSAETANLLQLETQFNQACVQNNQPLVNHIDTASTIKDMDQLRLAMGLETFSYFGRSYGTFIGNRYAALFPGHLRAMVLDAVVDHSVSDQKIATESHIAFDASWQLFKLWCQNTTTCSLRGQNIDQVFDQVLARAHDHPIPAPFGFFSTVPVDDWALTLAVQAATVAGRAVFAWADAMISQARDGDASMARFLYDALTGRLPDGSYRSGEGTHRAIACVDIAWSSIFHSQADVESFAAFTKTVAPRYGVASVYQGIAQCYNYPLPAVEPPPVASDVPAGQPPVLLVTATADASTPAIWAARVSSKIPGSRILLRNGDGHVSYTKSTCIQQKVDRYLVDLTLPSSGTICSTDLNPDQPPPVLGPSLAANSASAQQEQVAQFLEGFR